MNKRTLKALRGSIKKWRDIADGTGIDRGGNNCPLCKLFAGTDDYCSGCPVRAKTKKTDCVGTPYWKWLRLGPPDADGFGWLNGKRAVSAKARAVARQELRFLESLLPEGESP